MRRPRRTAELVRIIRGIERIEAAGGKVMVGSADVSDLAQMSAVVRDACAEFGDINAVIHAAGVSGTTPIGLKTPEEVDQVLGSKILGLAVLEQIFADRDLDFVALFSSTSAIWGRVGQVDYTAANAYLDAWSAAALDRSRWPVISMNWDNWREVGMAVNTLRLSPGQDKSSALKVGLTTAEGIRAFDESLVARHTQVIVRGAPPGLRKGQAGARAGARGGGEGGGSQAQGETISAPCSRSSLSGGRAGDGDRAGRSVDRSLADRADRRR